MKVILYTAFIALMLTSCSTLEKKIEKAKSVAYANPKSFAEFCGNVYPPKESYIKGKDSTIVDTLVRRDTVTVFITGKDGRIDTVKLPCPPCKGITKTIFRTDTVKQENTAKLEAVMNDKMKFEQMYALENKARLEAGKTAKNRLWYLIGLLGVIGVGVVLKIKGWLPF